MGMKRSIRLLQDNKGMMAVETAIVATVVALLSLGAFQVSAFVAKQNELQGAAADAQAIALAAKPSTQSQLDTIKSIIMTSTGLTTNQVTVSYIYRCGTDSAMITSSSSCNGNGANKLWTYVHIVLTNTYSPVWSSYGLGSGVNLKVDRTVQIS
jgi:Flp pilus assembly protein TadG